MDNKIRVALIVIKNDKNLRLKVIVHAGVVEVAGDAAGVDGRGSPHGVVAHRVAARQHLGQEHVMNALGRPLGEVMGITRFAGEVAALSEHGGVLPAHPRVEVVLADPVHHVLGGAVEQMPLVHDPVEPRHLFGHVFLFPGRENGR